MIHLAIYKKNVILGFIFTTEILYIVLCKISILNVIYFLPVIFSECDRDVLKKYEIFVGGEFNDRVTVSQLFSKRVDSKTYIYSQKLI